MSTTLRELTEAYGPALQEYLAEPQEASRARAYELGRQAVALGAGVADLAIVHGQALALALAGAAEAEDRARLTRAAAEFLGETMAPFEMVLRGYREANALLQRLNGTLEERVAERTSALRESEERYRDLFENAGDLIQGTTSDGRFLYVNKAWRSHLGYRPEDVPALSVWDIVARDQHEAFREVCARAARGESLVWAESVFVARDGRKIIVEGTVNCQHVGSGARGQESGGRGQGAGGRATFVGLFRDITERRRMEEALQEAARRKDEFLAMLAHELRNPLAPIRNALQIMRLTGAAGHDGDQARDLMERQVVHLVRLIDDLMDVSRITRGKIELRKELLELAGAIQSAIEISRPHLEKARHELTVTLPAEPLLVYADPARLSQVVSNLLNNASKYTEAGGHIWLSCTREGEHAVLRVRDTGVGIPAAMLPVIFEPFVQVDPRTERCQGGLGIGLTLVQRLVQMHGGSVEAHSDGPGKGSEFVVRLPCASAPVAPSEEGPRTNGRATGRAKVGLRVLVVDDNRDAADSLCTLMTLTGHTVRVAYDGFAALEEVRAFKPHILLQDIEMPGMSGYEVARALREDHSTRNMLLVALTGYGSAEDRLRCLGAGFDHHLVKPVEFETLQELLASLAALS